VALSRPPIRPLAPQVADAIAAGEVVERPAAAVKELAENALDAGPSRVEVEVEGGGLVRIAVSDDGAGIPAAELPLAVARHATSKLAALEELAAVRSLGFRGEALASIAAVSELRLLSRAAGSEAAWSIRCRGGEVLEHRPAARAPGTTAEACDLFHNTPARLAFLRAERAETAACLRIVSDLALTHPEVAFTCRSGGRLVLRTPGGTLAEAAAAVWGRDSGELLEVEAPGEISVSGLISEPRRHRATRAGLVLVVNGRRVHNRALVAAVEEAYAGLLPAGRHPFGMVAVALDPALVDVNVHPTKREVRLREEGRVFAAVQRACWAALQGAHLGGAVAPIPPLTGPGRLPGGGGLQVRDAGPVAPSRPGLSDRLAGGAAAAWGAGVAAAAAAAAPGQGPSLPGHRLTELSPLRALAQAADGWLVADSPRGLCLVDPHAAHEKVLYAELMADGAAPGPDGAPPIPCSSQPLLLEAAVRVDAAAAGLLEESTGILAGLGFELEAFGPGLALCRAVPAAAAGRDPERLVREVLEGLLPGDDPPARRRRLAALTACHAAVRLGDRLDLREQARLLERLVTTPGGLTCPHGRPTVIVLDDATLRRAFGRPAL
jgi:DNA mismatch repair protein MutL